MEYKYPNVRCLRLLRGKSQKELAQILEITTQQYNLYENGKREIPLHVLIKIADFFCVSVDGILERYSFLSAEEAKKWPRL